MNSRCYRLGQVLSTLVMLLLFIPETLPGQSKIVFDSSFSALKYRSIGPYRGGRSAAVAGVPGKPMTFYFGGTGGGVWKTNNGGQTWESLSDGFFGGSIGSIAVSDWDPNVIYVGGGEVTVRGNVSHGSAMWKTDDAGKTWKNIGLKDSRHIPRIRIHPRNPDLVYAAVLGHLFGPSKERGVYRTKDGGKSWERILFVNDEVGAVDIAMDPSNPRILFASMWRVKRTPYSLESGGPGSGLWKSVDGGDTWKEITKSKGLPDGEIGIIGVTVSPVNPDRVWAIIEANEGGVFRSDDGGTTWRNVNDERKLRQRAWYYTRIYADTKNEDMVYVVNVQFWRSKDGGKSYESIRTPHGDHHDLWIAPEDPDRMIIGDDGGAQVTFDGGEGWSSYYNQPTAQFYRVTTDNHFPYRIYGAQQDNSTVRIVHRSGGATIGERDWESTAGGESGWVAPHPSNPNIVYGGSYDGYLTRYDHANEQFRLIDVWPDNPMGHGAKDARYRFQWNFPIFFSPHNTDLLYAAGNVLFKTTNEGQSWTPISPDLTRNDTTKLGPSGGPITRDNTSVEYYCTIFTALESPLQRGLLWTGSDDGLIYVSRDGGTTWTNVTPSKSVMPEWIQINSIEAHPTNPRGLYIAATMYKSDDFRPYLYKTTDFGKNWDKITDGIDAQDFTRVIRADPEKPGVLYAGTENGMYISFNDGESWKKFQQNLPTVPITDLAIKNNDLIVATQGRSFWVLDDLTLVHQLGARVLKDSFTLFKPRETFRMPGGHVSNPKIAGENPQDGVVVNYYFPTTPDSSSVKLKIMDGKGKLIKSYMPKAKEKSDRMSLSKGLNQFVWNMRYPDAEEFPEMILWAGGTEGPTAVPGKYSARLIVGKDSSDVPFTIRQDLRSSATEADLKAQFDFVQSVRDKLTETHQAIKRIRNIRKQINSVDERIKGHAAEEEIKKAGKEILDRLNTVEEALYQTKNKSGQDPLNFPIRLNDKLSGVGSGASAGDYRPTDQSIAVRDELVGLIDKELATLKGIVETDLPAFNALVKSKDIPAVAVEEKENEEGGAEK